MSELKPDKGKMNGSCNRTACQRPGATWFNTSTRAYYCEPCARDITTFTKRADGFHICFPSSGNERADAAMKFGWEPQPIELWTCPSCGWRQPADRPRICGRNGEPCNGDRSWGHSARAALDENHG